MLGGPCEAGMNGQLRNCKKNGRNDENQMNSRSIHARKRCAVRLNV